MNNRLLHHYQQELGLLNNLAEEFATGHPKIAGRLRLDGKNIADPETGCLLQTCALSNARVSYQLEDDYSFLSGALLNILHPHLNAPLPAFSIIQFEADSSKLNAKLSLAKNLELQTTAKNGEVCYFQTCYAVDIFPVKITVVELISKPAAMPIVSFLNQSNAFLRIKLEGLDNKTILSGLGLEKLRFFIDLPHSEAHKLYELIFNHCIGIIAVNDSSYTSSMILPLSTIQAVGFQSEDEILPYGQATEVFYRLLTEFFAYPEKFLFFDIADLSRLILGDSVEIIFYLNQSDHQLEKSLKSENLKLFCTPVINLFEAETSRVEINPLQQQYLLPTDKNVEIYRVNAVTVHFDDHQEKILKPFENYHVLQKPAWEAGEYLKSGIESFIYFPFLHKFFSQYKNPHISSKVLCTNRNLPTQLEGENLLLVNNSTDVLEKIFFLKKITPASRRFLQPGVRWQYLSTLNLNYFSLTPDQEGLNALRSVLKIYKAEILRGVLSVRTQMMTIRSADRFCQGIKINLQLDEAKFDAIGLYLFCKILSYFFTAWFPKKFKIILAVLSVEGKELYVWKTQ